MNNLKINSTTLPYDDAGISEARVSYNKHTDDREVRLNGRQTIDGDTYIQNMAPDKLSAIIRDYILEHLESLQVVISEITFSHDVHNDKKQLREVGVTYNAEHNRSNNNFNVSGTIALSAEEYEGNESVPVLEGIVKERIAKEFETEENAE